MLQRWSRWYQRFQTFGGTVSGGLNSSTSNQFQFIGIIGWFLHAIITIATSLVIATARPYKRNYMNILESLMLALVGLLSLLILAYQYLLPADTHLLLPYLIITFASIPQLVLALYK